MTAANFMHVHIGDWQKEVAGFTVEQEGFFFRLCRLLYAYGGCIPDDDGRNARRMGVDPRVYRRGRAFLLAEGKLIVQDGELSQPRVSEDLSRLNERRSMAAEHGRKGPEARRRRSLAEAQSDLTNDTSGRSSRQVREKSPESPTEVGRTRRRISSKNSVATMHAPAPAPAPSPRIKSAAVGDEEVGDAAQAAFNDAANTFGFQRCNALTFARRRRLGQRLVDLGCGDRAAGLIRFQHALSAIGHWPFLAGREKPRDGQERFRLHLDRLLSTETGLGDVLAKLCDLYDERGSATAPNTAGSPLVVPRATQLTIARRYLRTEVWDRDLGPPPGSPGCPIDAEVLAEARAALGHNGPRSEPLDAGVARHLN